MHSIAAIIVGVLVSLMPPVSKDMLDLFYFLSRTPVTDGEQVSNPCTLPEGVVPPERAMWYNTLGLEIPVICGTLVVGFVAGWLAIAALIGGFVWMIY